MSQSIIRCGPAGTNLVRRGRSSWARRSSSVMLGVGLLVGTASVASAASYYTFYQSPSGGVAPSTWKSKAVPGQAKYNGARVSTYDSGSAYAYVYVPEVGTASAPGTVVTSFAYQGGTFKCKWTWIGHTGKGPLTCKLKYG